MVTAKDDKTAIPSEINVSQSIDMYVNRKLRPELLSSAPMCAASLGKLIMVVLKKDISIKGNMSKFDYMKHPNSLPSTLLQIISEGLVAFQTIKSNMSRICSKYPQIHSYMSANTRNLMTRDPEMIKDMVIDGLNNIMYYVNETQVLGNQILPTFINAEKLIQEVIQAVVGAKLADLHNRNGWGHDATLKLFSELRELWANLALFFHDVSLLFSKTNIKWQNYMGLIETVGKSLTFDELVMNEIISEAEKFYHASSIACNVAKMYIKIYDSYIHQDFYHLRSLFGLEKEDIEQEIKHLEKRSVLISNEIASQRLDMVNENA